MRMSRLLYGAAGIGLLASFALRRGFPRALHKGKPRGATATQPDASRDYGEQLIDEGLKESFPASDPLAVPRVD